MNTATTVAVAACTLAALALLCLVFVVVKLLELARSMANRIQSRTSIEAARADAIDAGHLRPQPEMPLPSPADRV